MNTSEDRDAILAKQKARTIEADKRLAMAREKLDDDRFAPQAIANALYAMVLLLRNHERD